MKFLVLLVYTFFLFISLAESNAQNDLVVPKPVMEFIMDCRKSKRHHEELVPVLKTNIDTEGGTTSQQVSLLGIDELQATLKTAIESDDVTDHIIGKIRKEFLPSEGPSFRTEMCPPTINKIEIKVPPQELKFFHQRMERVLQQNNNVLLSQVKDIITAKFADMERNIADLVMERTQQINENVINLSRQLPRVSEPISLKSFSDNQNRIDSDSIQQQTESTIQESTTDDLDIAKEFFTDLVNSFQDEPQENLDTTTLLDTEVTTTISSIPLELKADEDAEEGDEDLHAIEFPIEEEPPQQKEIFPSDAEETQPEERSNLNSLTQLLKGTRFAIN